MTDKPIETNGTAPAGSEATAGGSGELNALLTEFETPAPGKSETKSNAVNRVLAEMKPVVDYVRSDMETKQKAAVEETLKTAIAEVKGDLKDIPDKVVRGWLYERSENESFRTAFLNRHKDPSAWSAAVAAAGKDFSTEFKAEETKRVASDINAARASISGASETRGETQREGPSVTDKWKMSGRDWEDYKRAHYA